MIFDCSATADFAKDAVVVAEGELSINNVRGCIGARRLRAVQVHDVFAEESGVGDGAHIMVILKIARLGQQMHGVLMRIAEGCVLGVRVTLGS